MTNTAEIVRNAFEKCITNYKFSGKLSPFDKLKYIYLSRKGLDYSCYSKLLLRDEPFILADWAAILNVNIRTLERYKKRKQKLDLTQSDRFIEIMQLLLRGIEVFGEWEIFREWLHAENLALGKHTPKELLDTNFGIDLVKDELARIEYGILA